MHKVKGRSIFTDPVLVRDKRRWGWGNSTTIFLLILPPLPTLGIKSWVSGKQSVHSTTELHLEPSFIFSWTYQKCNKRARV
jgi:hypothetical protein